MTETKFKAECARRLKQQRDKRDQKCKFCADVRGGMKRIQEYWGKVVAVRLLARQMDRRAQLRVANIHRLVMA